TQDHLPAPERGIGNGAANGLQRWLPLDAARARQPDDGRFRRGANLSPDVSVKTAGARGHLRGNNVMARLPLARDRERVERVHGPGALDEAPVLIARLVAEPRHRLDTMRGSTNKPRRWMARQRALEAPDRVLIGVPSDLRQG